MKYFLSYLLTLFTFHSFAQELKEPKIDERIELLSIVFRMADSEEYSAQSYKYYTDRIYNHFEPYKNHELMNFIKELRNTHSVGYDAVMAMAINIGPSPNFEPLQPFNSQIPDSRWSKDRAMEFLTLLKKFYTDANCEAFFRQNRDLYIDAAKQYLPIYNKIDVAWYEEFYGNKPDEDYNIILGLGNGYGNYGPRLDIPGQKKEVYAILGASAPDTLTLPQYSIDTNFPTLLHEFNHSFVNYFPHKYASQMKGAAKMYKKVSTQMQTQAYASWQTMYNESLVRAAVIKYMKDHQFEQSAIDAEVLEQLNRGFIWINDLVAELENYDDNRKQYPTLESYSPNLILFFNKWAKEINTKKKEFDKRKPKVISIEEFKNGSNNVSASLKTITIVFDRPLLAKGISIHYGDKGQEYFPKITKRPVYSDDHKKLTIDVDLLPGKEYQLVLTGRHLKSEDGIGMDDYEVLFKTSKE